MSRNLFILTILLILLSAFFAGCGGEPYGIAFEQETLDFGTLDEGKTIELVYHFKNTGTKVLEIPIVEPSCGCTTMGQWDKIVAPGKSGEIHITFDSEGFQNKVVRNVTVVTNIPDKRKIYLSLEGNVFTPVELTPHTLWMGETTDDTTPLKGSFNIKNNLASPLKIARIIMPDARTTYTLETIKEEQEYRLDFQVAPPFEGEGKAVTQKAILIIAERDPERTISAAFSYFYKNPIRISPAHLSLGEIKEGSGPLKGSFEIVNNIQEPLNISEIIPPDSQTLCQLVTLEAEQKYRLDFTVQPPFHQGVTTEKLIRIITGAGEEYSLSFSYLFPPVVQVYPLEVLLDTVKVRSEDVERRINIKNNQINPISLLNIRLQAPGMEYSVTELRKGLYYQIALKFPKGFQFPSSQEPLFLEFRVEKDPLNKLYTIPIKAQK